MNATLPVNRADLEPVSRPMEYALNVVKALGESGMTAVPLKPNAAMLAAGARAGGVTVEVAWKIYQAMINEGN
ncbi:MAG TPA: hypothetical protein VEB64_00405 [Azospirillaceae bacterium]|nr:hypothetical protein [Azospirillaceae bacterium]